MPSRPPPLTCAGASGDMAATAARRVRAALFMLVLAVAEVEGGIFFSAFSASNSRSTVMVYNPTSTAVSYSLIVVNDAPPTGSRSVCTRSGNRVGCPAGGGTAAPGENNRASLSTTGQRHFDRASMLYLVVNTAIVDVIGQQG